MGRWTSKEEIIHESGFGHKRPFDLSPLKISLPSDFIVSNNKHFKVLKSVDFPKVEVVGIDQFLKMIEGL